MIVRLRLIDGQDPARRLGIGARRSEQHGPLGNGKNSPLSHNMGRYRRLVNAGAALPLQRAVIDEVQRAPQLLLAIKRAVDTDRRPGRFLLSGSADLM